jgi:2,4-dienoyl-CoA reductase-like NADH-dependent reductase (Old Yellow Enzyme family)
MIFEPLTIGNVTFKNRLVRSSIGGRSAYYDGTVNNAWKNFEFRFARNGLGGIISATLNVNRYRWSPLEYPQISDDKFIRHLAEGIRAVQSQDCRYIIQIGDAGYHTQTSLFSQHQDQLSSSSGFDLLYGYRTTRSEMTTEDIEQSVAEFGRAARRVRETGADGVEVTATKGYLIHQFLNPAINRRTDRYGGSVAKRFQFLREIITEVRRQVGPDFLVGVRISAHDYNYLPVNLRLPPSWRFKDYLFGNDIHTYLTYGKWLKELGVGYLLITNGFGFINPHDQPGDFPLDEIRMFVNSTRHLSTKASLRAYLLNGIPKPLLQRITSIGWHYKEAINLPDARRFREEVGLPIIANGGFQHRSVVQDALESGGCDLVSMARPLLANPDLPELFRAGKEAPDRLCTFCNRCPVRTTLFPLGCYDPSRFDTQDDMEAQILYWSARPDFDGVLPWDPEELPSTAWTGGDQIGSPPEAIESEPRHSA